MKLSTSILCLSLVMSSISVYANSGNVNDDGFKVAVEIVSDSCTRLSELSFANSKPAAIEIYLADNCSSNEYVETTPYHLLKQTYRNLDDSREAILQSLQSWESIKDFQAIVDQVEAGYLDARVGIFKANGQQLNNNVRPILQKYKRQL